MSEHDRLGRAGPGRRQRGWTPSEVLFLLSLPLALAAVIYSGTLSFKEGQRLEVAKANGQGLVSWAEAAASANEKGESFEPHACSTVQPVEKVASDSASHSASAAAAHEAQEGSSAASSAESSAGTASAAPAAPAASAAVVLAATSAASAASVPAPTWGKCRQALLAKGGPLAEAKNPFNPKESVLGTKCERDKPLTRGQVVVEKGTSPPAGISGSVTYGAIEDSEPMVKGLMLKILVCDKGSYPIKVAEVKL